MYLRSMAAENSSAGIKDGGTHPATAERFMSIDKAYEEIQDKKKWGLKYEARIEEDHQENTHFKLGEEGTLNN